jgi:hypothetical protein
MKNFFKKSKQEYYRNLLEYYLNNVDFENIIKTINNDSENLGKLPTFDDYPQSDSKVRVYKNGNQNNGFQYSIYCDSIRIVLTTNGYEKLIQISILGQDEKWKVITENANGKTNIDITSTETKVYNVYTYCDIIMPTGRLMSDERYTSGTWNEYVYNTVKSMIEYVESFSESNKYNKLYETFYTNGN